METRPPLGRGRPPQTADIEESTRLSRDVTLALTATLAASSCLL